MGMDSEPLKHVENTWKATKGDTKGSTKASAEGKAKGYAKGNAGECAPREGFQQIYLLRNPVGFPESQWFTF